MEIVPVVVGHGLAAQAMQRALAITALLNSDPQLIVKDTRVAKRGQPLEELRGGGDNAVLFLANPHALHASAIIEAERAGFKAVIAEKPVCVTAEQLTALKTVNIPVSVCHGYRVMWGPRTIRQMIAQGELGKVIAIEGRYWQSSAAQRALDPTPAFQLWKNNPALSGPADALMDLGSHWVDMVAFLFGEQPRSGSVWVSYANAEAPHRDTHVHMDLLFSDSGRARASISKTVHGARNDFEFTVVGTRRSAGWSFMNPDILQLGEGGELVAVPRKDASLGAASRPFHGLGWLEGYTEIIKQTLLGLLNKSTAPVPTLEEALQVMETIFSLERLNDK